STIAPTRRSPAPASVAPTSRLSRLRKCCNTLHSCAELPVPISPFMVIASRRATLTRPGRPAFEQHTRRSILRYDFDCGRGGGIEIAPAAASAFFVKPLPPHGYDSKSYQHCHISI